MKTPIVLFGLLSLLFTAASGAEPSAPPALTDAVQRPCKIIQTVQPRFPLRMTSEGISQGVVTMVLRVNAEGKLADHLITAYTNRAFADEAERAVQRWQFEAGVWNGQPVDSIFNVTLNFEEHGTVVQRESAEALSFKEQEGYAYQACSLQKLDCLPTPVKVVSPTYPKEWADQGIAGAVEVDFYIDETGKVRMPSVEGTANPALAGIAVAAVRQWEFAPPTRNGRFVLVHARQLFHFGQAKSP